MPTPDKYDEIAAKLKLYTTFQGGPDGGADHRTWDDVRADIAAAIRDAVAERKEEAAKVCDQKSFYLPHYSDLERGYAQGRADAAAEIRGLP